MKSVVFLAVVINNENGHDAWANIPTYQQLSISTNKSLLLPGRHRFGVDILCTKGDQQRPR